MFGNVARPRRSCGFEIVCHSIHLAFNTANPKLR